MTLNELLKVIDDDVRIQIQIRMFGSAFCTNQYKSALLKTKKQLNFLH